MLNLLENPQFLFEKQGDNLFTKRQDNDCAIHLILKLKSVKILVQIKMLIKTMN